MRIDRNRMEALVWMVAVLLFMGAAAWHVLHRFEVVQARVLWAFLLLLVPMAGYVARSGPRVPRVQLPTLVLLGGVPSGLRTHLRHLPMSLSLAGMALLLLAMARPQSPDNWRDVKREGIDIMIAMDVSTSMLARDLRPDRLEASKQVAIEFIDARPDDRIGLVVYEGEAFTQCPLTTDHRVLRDLFVQARPGLIDGGTAIGMGLSTALNRLRESEARSKVLILLTDGMNNAGMVQPLDAARMAETLGIRVYTIGVGTRGKALSPVERHANGQYRYDYVDVNIDDAMLERIATMTGGRYFRATDEGRLRDIYREIDELEKTRIKVTEHSTRNEEYLQFAMLGAGLLLLGALMDRTFLRSLT